MNMIRDCQVAGDLDAYFRKLGVVGGKEKMVITEWKNLPMELLLRIMSLVDDSTILVASDVCTGSRGALCFGLTNLSLSWCKCNENKLVTSVVPKFTKLRTLILRQNVPQLEDDAMEAIAVNCHDLEVLDLSKNLKLTDRSLYALTHGCPHLTKLNISGCSAFNDTALAHLTSLCKNLGLESGGSYSRDGIRSWNSYSSLFLLKSKHPLNLCGCVRAASTKRCRLLHGIATSCSSLTLDGVTQLVTRES